MAEIITLSSEDEEVPAEPIKKRMKLTTLSGKVEEKKIEEADSCIVLLDDDDDEDDGEHKEIVETDLRLEIEKNQSERNERTINGDAAKVSEEKKEEGVVKNGAGESTSVKLNNTDGDDKTVSSPPPKESENEFQAFVEDCMKNLANSQHKSLVAAKLPTLQKLYEKISKHDEASKELIGLIETSRTNLRLNPQETVIYFTDIYKWCKATYKDFTESRQTCEHNEKIIKKLEKTLLKIRKKIRTLESAEIDFDDEENSTYIQMDRYMNRASQIYTKLCKYRQENPRHGRLLYCRLDFSSSKHSEINKAINKKYKNNLVFPNYYDLDKCIRQCVQENEIKLSSHDLNCEIKSCFEALGVLLKRRRQRDLYSNQRSYIENTTDPANESPEIGVQIDANQKVYNKKLDELMEKYTRLQEKGVEPDVSSESEDSNVAESDSEHDENVTENV